MWVLWVLACGTEPVTPVAEKGPEDASAEAVSHFPEALLPAKLDARPAVYVHEEAGPCADCHTAQAEDWRDSPHDLALGPAEAALGDFDGQVIDLEGLKARPFQEGDLRLVEVTDGAGTRRYKVLHTFGHDPLQQVLLEGDRGALWVAPIAWDVAGERWFDPSPEGVAADPADPLYWAGLFGTWNHMCASCHSTGVVEAYTPATASYQTTWTHEDVACEGCHGEGAEVQTLARGPEQVETCGACHSRRDPLSPGWKPGDPLLDHFTPALLDSEIYALDGGIQDDLEAFVWGSFSQSAMARAGVRCTHCHEPHGTGLVAEGNALCTTCHLARFDAVEHDRSQDCVACHMPESNYMGIDGRRDHRFGVPGRTSQPLTPTLLARARGGDPRAAPDLLAVAGDPGAGAFYQASALALLRRQAPPAEFSQVLAGLSDPSELVRWQAVELLAAWGQGPALWPMLDDSIRAVRFAAARGLLTASPQPPTPEATERLEAVTEDLRSSLSAEADEPASHLNLAVIDAVSGDQEAAISGARTALRMAPAFWSARQMLATLLQQAGRVDEAQAVLEEGAQGGVEPSKPSSAR